LKRLEALPRSFFLIMAFLVRWWGTASSAIGWMLVEASAPPPIRIFSGVYAVREMSPSNPDSIIFGRIINRKTNKAAKRNMIA